MDKVQKSINSEYIELINSILFALIILGRTLLIHSGYLITQCGYTYSVRLMQMLCRSHGVARSNPTLWLSDYTVWIHLLSKAGAAALPIPW
jgi:hypothetical protein